MKKSHFALHAHKWLAYNRAYLAYSESRARLHDLYGVLKKGVVDRAIQTLDHTWEERK